MTPVAPSAGPQILASGAPRRMSHQGRRVETPGSAHLRSRAPTRAREGRRTPRRQGPRTTRGPDPLRAGGGPARLPESAEREAAAPKLPAAGPRRSPKEAEAEAAVAARLLVSPLPSDWTVRGSCRGAAPVGLRLRLPPLRLPLCFLLLRRRRRSSSH